MTMDGMMRRVHRWVAWTFMATVAAVFAAQGLGTPPDWLYLAPLVPLAGLALTGLWMLVRPHLRAQGVRP